MRATAAALVKNGVAPKRAVRTDLVPGCRSVATATGMSDQAARIRRRSTPPRPQNASQDGWMNFLASSRFVGAPFPWLFVARQWDDKVFV
jgi:hypothetical protein